MLQRDLAILSGISSCHDRVDNARRELAARSAGKVLDAPSILNKWRRRDRVRLIHYSIFGLEAAEHAEKCRVWQFALPSPLLTNY